MKILIKILTLAILFGGYHSVSYAKSNEIQMEQGQTKTVYLKMAGALTASRVTVSGAGVTATILNKYPGKVRVRLRTTEGTPGGLRSINVRLLAGTNKTPLYIYGIEHAPVNVTGPSRTGYLQKIEITIPAIAGKLNVISKSASCYGSTTGKADNSVRRQSFPVKPSARKRTFWVTSNQNSINSTNCVVEIRQISTIGKKWSQPRLVTVDFNQDRSVPTNLTAPSLRTATNTVQITANKTGNSPRLNWRAPRNSNFYQVNYKLHHTSRWFKKELPRNSYIPKLDLGTYDWCVKAGHRSNSQSILQVPISDCSATRRFIVRQRN